MTEIVREHVTAQGALFGDTNAMRMAADEEDVKLQRRLDNDPAFAFFAAHYAGALAGALRVMPPPVHATLIRKCIEEVIVEWERANIEFNEQPKTNPVQ
jgi:hypothetical protein